ncbi:MAG: phosphate ABC transporter permease PstA [Rhodospirillaceae bacterium]
MSDAVQTPAAGGATPTSAKVVASLRRRHSAERRFRIYGVSAVTFAVLCLVALFGNILGNALPAFQQTVIKLPVTFAKDVIDPNGTGDPKVIGNANYRALARNAIYGLFPDVSGRRDKRQLAGLLSSGVDFQLRDLVLADPSVIGTIVEVEVLASDDMDQFFKGNITRDVPESERRIKDREIAWIDKLAAEGRVETEFNTTLFTAGDSREPELAGFRGAIVGSFYTMLVTLILAFPVGVSAAVYLEEYAPKNIWTQLIEVTINNLAAVPSIVFGLLGLAVFLNFMNFPRSAPVVGGMVLSLMTLPTVIIAARAAMKSVPPSIREAALGMGASRLQMVLHHVLPLAFPGILTGTIIGMAQALGETAPLLMIGMVAFIVDIPGGIADPATVMPVQIYLWSDSPERAFVERTAAGTAILICFLIVMNVLAVILRKKFERKW